MLALNRLEQRVDFSQADEIVCHVGVFKEGYDTSSCFRCPNCYRYNSLLLSLIKIHTYCWKVPWLKIWILRIIYYSRHFQVESQPSGRSTVVVCCKLTFPFLSGFILKFPKKKNLYTQRSGGTMIDHSFSGMLQVASGDVYSQEWGIILPQDPWKLAFKERRQKLQLWAGRTLAQRSNSKTPR